MLPKRDLGRSFGYAIEGILHVLRTERNMRIHFLIAILVLLFAMTFRLTEAELAILFLTISLVLVCEMFNTAVEAVVDLISPRYHALARIAKNVSAGAVLISAIGAGFIGFIMFFSRLGDAALSHGERLLRLPATAILVGIGLVLLLTVILKASSGDFSIQGGMPSLHAALAFSLATAVLFLSENGYTVILAGLIALLVCQSRIEAGIHSFIEVLAGALLGILTTMLVFQLL